VNEFGPARSERKAVCGHLPAIVNAELGHRAFVEIVRALPVAALGLARGPGDMLEIEYWSASATKKPRKSRAGTCGTHRMRSQVFERFLNPEPFAQRVAST